MRACVDAIAQTSADLARLYGEHPTLRDWLWTVWLEEARQDEARQDEARLGSDAPHGEAPPTARSISQHALALVGYERANHRTRQAREGRPCDGAFIPFR